jgi:hypothetical protein
MSSYDTLLHRSIAVSRSLALATIVCLQVLSAGAEDRRTDLQSSSPMEMVIEVSDINNEFLRGAVFRCEYEKYLAKFLFQ